MLQTTVKFENLRGVEVEEQLEFNLNTVELAKLANKYDPVGGDLEKYMIGIRDSGNYLKMITLMSEIVLEAYGHATPDGRGFLKPPAERNAFKDSLAYAEYVELLATDEVIGTEFANAVLNVNIDRKLEEVEKRAEGNREQRRANNKESKEREAFRKWQQEQNNN